MSKTLWLIVAVICTVGVAARAESNGARAYAEALLAKAGHSDVELRAVKGLGHPEAFRVVKEKGKLTIEHQTSAGALYGAQGVIGGEFEPGAVRKPDFDIRGTTPPMAWMGRRLPGADGQPDRRSACTVIPDLTRGLFYAICRDAVRAHRLDATLAVVGSRSAKMPRWMSGAAGGGMVTSLYYGPRGAGVPTVRTPLAATLDGKLHIFLIHSPTGVLYRYVTDAFTTAAPKKPSAAKDRFPTRIAQGKPLSWNLTREKPGATFALLKGPQNMAVSRQGVLTWTPGPGDVGRHKLKIKAVAGDDVSFLRYEVEVVSADITPRQQK